MSPRVFNGTNTEFRELLKIHQQKGGDHLSFNKQFDQITINGRSSTGFRSGGARGLRILYKDQATKDAITRKQNIELSTPLDSDKKAGAAKFRGNKGTGLDMDHINRVERSGNALREMDIPRQAQWHGNMAEAGIAVGDDPGNLEPTDPKFNRGADRQQHVRMDKGLNKLDQVKQSPTNTQLSQTRTTSTKGRQTAAVAAQRRLPGFPKMRGNLGMNANLLMLLPEIVQVADNYTDGAVTRTVEDAVNGAVDTVKTGISNGVNGLASLFIPNKQSNVNYGQY